MLQKPITSKWFRSLIPECPFIVNLINTPFDDFPFLRPSNCLWVSALSKFSWNTVSEMSRTCANSFYAFVNEKYCCKIVLETPQQNFNTLYLWLENEIDIHFDALIIIKYCDLKYHLNFFSSLTTDSPIKKICIIFQALEAITNLSP